MQFDLRWPYFAILREMRRKISIIDVGLAGKKNFFDRVLFVCWVTTNRTPGIQALG
jgi:hypothetical protein